MRFLRFILVASIFFLASARIQGLSAPSTVTPGDEITVHLLTQGYIQETADVAVTFGWSAPPGHRCTIGRSPNMSAYIGPEHSNLGPPKNPTVDFMTQVPSWISSYVKDGQVQLGAAVFSVVGISGMPTLQLMNLTLEVGKKTSGEYVETREFYWGNSDGGCP